MQNFRVLGAPPPDPLPPAAGGFTPRPPLASSGWGLRPHTPKTAPAIANFWLRAWSMQCFLSETFRTEHFGDDLCHVILEKILLIAF